MKRTEEEKGVKKREEEKEENKTERVRKRCEGFCFGGGFLKSSVKVVTYGELRWFFVGSVG